MKIVLDVDDADLINFLKENTRKITEIPLRTIADSYLYTPADKDVLVIKDEDFEYMPDNLLPSILDWFMHSLSFAVVEGWERKFDNIVSIIKKKNANPTMPSGLYGVYKMTNYEPLFDYIVYYFKWKPTDTEYRIEKKKEELTKMEKYNPAIYKKYESILVHDSVLDMSIGLRGAGLPTLVVDNIANHAYDLNGYSVYELIQSVNERKN